MKKTKTNYAFMNAKAMMSGFIICLLTAFVILIAPIGSYAGEQTENMAARIESTGDEFETLQAAIDAASSGDTIIVLRDLNETSSVSGKELTIDLNGSTISGKDSNGEDICGGKSLLSVTDGSDVTIKNGILRDGKGTVKYDGGKRTDGAGAVYVYDSHVNIISVDFIDNKETSGGSLPGSSIYVNTSSLNVDDCTFDNSNPDSYADTTHAAIGVESGKDVTISNSSFTHQIKHLNIYDCESLTVENSIFSDSKISGSNTQTFIAIRGNSPTNTFTNCVFENNEIYRQSNSSIIRIEGHSNSNNVIFDSCTIRNNTSEANKGSNQVSYIVYVNTSGRTNLANVTLKDSLISDNKTGGSAVYVTSGGSLTLENSVIKNNTSEMVQEKASPRGAGIDFEGQKLVIGAGSAVYNNTLITFKTDTLPSHDIYINTKNSKGTVDVASINDFADFDDPDFDFSEYVWKDSKESGFEEQPGDCSNDMFYYTITKKSDLMVAQIGDVIYESLEDAFAAAKDGDSIVIVAEAPVITVTEPIEVDKDITLIIEGHAVALKSSEDPLFTVKEKGKLTLKNDKTKEANDINSGIKTGEIVIEDGGELVIDDNMNLNHISNNGTLKINALIKNLDVSLGEDKFVTLGDAYDNASQRDMTLLLSLEDSVIEKLNSGDGSEVKVVSGGGESFVPATKVNGINSSVDKTFKNNGIVLRSCKAVYLKSSGSDENSGATAEEAVATFAKAKELAGSNGVIIICGQVTIADEQEWSLPENVKVVRDDTYAGYLIVLNNGGSLSMKDISVSGGYGQGTVAQQALIKVNSGAKLSIHDGTVLSDNKNRNSSPSEYRFGGAIYCSGGSVTMDGGSIERCEACYGGGITLYEGIFNMTGGVIKDCDAITEYSNGISFQGCGGAVMLIGGAKMYMGDESGTSSPVLSGNYAEGSGGAVSVGNLYIIDAWYFYIDADGNPVNKGTAFIMKSGQIDNNIADRTGGGIFVQDSMEAYIYGGAITNNKAYAFGNRYFAGGGIYVNGLHSVDNWTYEVIYYDSALTDYEKNLTHGYLYLENVEITNNTANWLGGAFAACNVSKTTIGDLTTIIYDNKSLNNGGNEGNITYSDNVDIFLSQIGMHGFTGIPHAPGYLSQYAIGGAEYNWEDAYDNNHNLIDTDELYFNKSSLQASTALTGSDEGVKNAVKGAKVLISGNYSGTNAGGLGSDGIIIIGSILPKIDVSVEKKWDESTENLARPTKLKFDLYRAEGTEGKEELYKSVEVEPNEDGVFAYTWKDLLKYVPDTETEYVYTVKEDLSYAAVDAEGNPINLTELYISSVERGEDSNREIQRPKDDGTVATLNQIIQNYVIINSLREETVLPEYEKEKEGEVKGLVEEKEVESVKSEVEPETVVKSAKTGDDNTLIFFAVMMIVAAAGLFGLRLSRKR